jgi:hypothetical protein
VQTEVGVIGSCQELDSLSNILSFKIPYLFSPGPDSIIAECSENAMEDRFKYIYYEK